VIWLLVLALSLLSGPVPAGAQATTSPVSVADDAPAVAPGQVARWSAPGTEECRRAQTTWRPLGETCWYPVDLLADPGTLVVERRRGRRWENALVRVREYPYEVQHLQIRDQSKVDLSPEDLARARRESRRVSALWSRVTPRRFTLPLTAPLAEMPVSGRFGARRVINGQPRSPHSGADYGAAAGTPVRAAADGTVVLAEEHFFAGNSVFLDHGDGLITMYFHLREISVKPGQEVKAGQRIGLVGSTGRATGPHLHFGVRWRGARVDPELLLHPERAPHLED
jgi:murein DD-endopeptidase MepM/ murein hydrolase activator NlpD